MTTFGIGEHQVSRLGYGVMQLPGPGVFGPPRDHDQAVAVLRRVIEAGVNHLDTSQYYGPVVANELIREALHPYPDDLAIVSKVGAFRDEQGGWLPLATPGDLRTDIEANLKTLGVDRLAAVNLRLMESSGPDAYFDEQLDVMIRARDEGLIAGIGLSNIELSHLERALQRTEIVEVQNPYNLLDRASQPVLDACLERGIAFVPFFPLGSAFVADNPVLGHPVVRAAAQELGRTPAQVVLAWTLGLAPNVLLIPGTSSLAHLEENLAVAEIELGEDTRRRLDALV